MGTTAYAVGDNSDWERQWPHHPQPGFYPVPDSRPIIIPQGIVFVELTEINIQNGDVVRKTNIPAQSITEFYEVEESLGVRLHTLVKTTNFGKCEMFVRETPAEIRELVGEIKNG